MFSSEPKEFVKEGPAKLIHKKEMGFGERVDTYFSPRMWHHAGRPTTGHSTETIEANSKHNRRRTIARLSWINKNSKREFLQKMNLIILLIK